MTVSIARGLSVPPLFQKDGIRTNLLRRERWKYTERLLSVSFRTDLHIVSSWYPIAIRSHCTVSRRHLRSVSTISYCLSHETYIRFDVVFLQEPSFFLLHQSYLHLFQPLPVSLLRLDIRVYCLMTARDRVPASNCSVMIAIQTWGSVPSRCLEWSSAGLARESR